MLEVSGSLNDFFDTIYDLDNKNRQIVTFSCQEPCSRGLRREDIASILTGSRLTPDRCKVFADGQDIQEQVFREGLPTSGPKNFFLIPGRLDAILKDTGATVVLDAVDEFPNFSQDICNIIRARLNAFSSANLYVSFGATRGFGGHRDDHDFIMFQVEGKKDWNIEDAMASPDFLDKERPPSLRSCITGPGTFMYVPKGLWHDPIAVGGFSVHVTCSVVRPTWKDFGLWLSSPQNNISDHSIGAAWSSTNICLFERFHAFWTQSVQESVLGSLTAFHDT